VPIDPRTRGEKLAFFLKRAGCKGIICADYCLPALEAVRGSLPALEWILASDGRGDDASAVVGAVPSRCESLSKPVPTLDSRLVNATIHAVITPPHRRPRVVFPNALRWFRHARRAARYQPTDRPFWTLSHPRERSGSDSRAVTSMGLRASSAAGSPSRVFGTSVACTAADVRARGNRRRSRASRCEPTTATTRCAW
jgi:hypothetical protein